MAMALCESPANRGAFARGVQHMPRSFMRRALELLAENGFAVVPAPHADPFPGDPLSRQAHLKEVMKIAAQAAIEMACENTLSVLPRDYATELYGHRHAIALTISTDANDPDFIRSSPCHAALVGLRHEASPEPRP